MNSRQSWNRDSKSRIRHCEDQLKEVRPRFEEVLKKHHWNFGQRKLVMATDEVNHALHQRLAMNDFRIVGIRFIAAGHPDLTQSAALLFTQKGSNCVIYEDHFISALGPFRVLDAAFLISTDEVYRFPIGESPDWSLLCDRFEAMLFRATLRMHDQRMEKAIRHGRRLASKKRNVQTFSWEETRIR